MTWPTTTTTTTNQIEGPLSHCMLAVKNSDPHHVINQFGLKRYQKIVLNGVKNCNFPFQLKDFFDQKKIMVLSSKSMSFPTSLNRKALYQRLHYLLRRLFSWMHAVKMCQKALSTLRKEGRNKLITVLNNRESLRKNCLGLWMVRSEGPQFLVLGMLRPKILLCSLFEKKMFKDDQENSLFCSTLCNLKL